MLRRWQLRRVHDEFLEASRNLREDRELRRSARYGCLSLLSPIPLAALTDRGAPLYEALRWMEENCRGRILDEETVKHYHRWLTLAGTAGGGEYRRKNIRVRESGVTRPTYDRVPALMGMLWERAKEEQGRLDRCKPQDDEDVLRVAVAFHQRLVFIHPFEDGNGRVARLAMNHLLRRYEKPYVILEPVDEAPEHMTALEEAHSGSLDRLIAYARTRLRRV